MLKACMKCDLRHIGCHSTCEAYQSERRLLDEYNASKNREISEYVSITQNRYRTMGRRSPHKLT